MSYENVRLS